MSELNQESNHPSMQVLGHGEAIASIMIGAASIAICPFGTLAGGSITYGIIGLILSIFSKKEGNTENASTVGIVLSIIGLVGAVISVFVSLLLINAGYDISDSYRAFGF